MFKSKHKISSSKNQKFGKFKLFTAIHRRGLLHTVQLSDLLVCKCKKKKKKKHDLYEIIIVTYCLHLVVVVALYKKCLALMYDVLDIKSIRIIKYKISVKLKGLEKIL